MQQGDEFFGGIARLMSCVKRIELQNHNEMITGYYCKPEAIVITSIAAQQRILKNWLNIGTEEGGPAGSAGRIAQSTNQSP